jgi:hypothetical protein
MALLPALRAFARVAKDFAAVPAICKMQRPELFMRHEH